MTVPGGKPVTELALFGKIAIRPSMIVDLILVIAELAITLNEDAVPRSNCACTSLPRPYKRTRYAERGVAWKSMLAKRTVKRLNQLQISISRLLIML